MKWTFLALWLCLLILFTSLVARPVWGQEYDLLGGSAAELIDLTAPALEEAPFHARIKNADGSMGSGTLFWDNGQYAAVLTAAHVFEESQEGVTVHFRDRKDYPARLVALHKGYDVAVLAIVSPGIPPAPVARRFVGRTFRLCGYGGQESILRVVSGRYVTRTRPPYPSAVVKGEVRRGDSGGGVFDYQGQLTGIIWGCRFEDAETYFRPLADCWQIVRRGLGRIEQFPTPGRSPELAPRRRLLVVGSAHCTACERLKVTLSQLNAEGFDTRYILHSDYHGGEVIIGYPTLLFLEGERVVDRLLGNVSREVILSKLKGD